MKLIVDDVSSLSGVVGSSTADTVYLSALTDLDVANLVNLGFPGFAASDPGINVAPEPAIIVTADARLGFLATGARRICDVAQLDALQANPDALFQYFVLWAPSEQLDEVLSVLSSVSGLVPLHRSVRSDTRLIGIAEAEALREIAATGYRLAVLGTANLPDTHDLYLLRLVGAARDDFLHRLDAGSVELLLASEDDLVIAVTGNAPLADLHVPGALHGHTLKLLPNSALLNPTKPLAGFATPAPIPAPEVVDRLRELIVGERIDEIIGWLSGRLPVTGGPIISRNIHHPDAKRAVTAIFDEFTNLGLVPGRQTFFHDGLLLDNVYADLPGTGDDTVWVTAHLDSTAENGFPGSDAKYWPGIDPAPGADDDGSGTAAVLAVAGALTTLAAQAPPVKSIRFALFNAEEYGMVGSQYFAKAAAEAGLAIGGVLQHDMVGFLWQPGNLSYEIHCGFHDDPAIEERSAGLAALVERSGSLLGELDAAEIYRSPLDTNVADGRSDHGSFHQRGYPAVCISEDFFAGTPEEPIETNPNYHRPTDQVIDNGFTTSIARATALAVWTLANT